MKKLSQIIFIAIIIPGVFGQGLTTSGVNGYIKSTDGEALIGANIIATHTPSGTQYGTTSMDNGQYIIINMKIGGPYNISISYIGYADQSQSDVYLNLGQNARVDFSLSTEALELSGVEVVAKGDDVLNSDRTGAATYVSREQVIQMPSIKRSTRDLTRLDPRSDGNFSFGGRNWLYNNISLDGSYFNNPFGLDDPAPGGQANAEPVSMDAVEQVTVSIAPFDIREGGFTGAGINTVTKSGTNDFTATVYAYNRNESLVGNSIGGEEILASPDLNFSQTGLSVGGPIMKDKLFFFANFEMERRTDPGSNYVANPDGTLDFGESRVSVETMDAIKQRMMDVYGYDTGKYQGYNHLTDNDKMLLKLDYNLSANHNLMFRYNRLRSYRDLGPHGFVLSHNNTGRGPNTSSLPFENSGYRINNDLDSYALELNSRFGSNIANKFFFSYNKFRDFREAKSDDFPTIEIGENGVTYTTVGHEPFSIHNILDQDVLQITNNTSYFMGNHTITGGFTYERFKFFNSFNIFRHGVFFLDASWAQFLGGTTFGSLDAFLAATSPDSATQSDFAGMVGSGPYKGELIDVGQLSFYGQDEISVNEKLKVTAGLRVDIPQYFTEAVANPFSTDSLSLLDENDQAETVDQAKLPDPTLLYSPRLGFNYDVAGDRSFQLRGGVGVFTGRLPFVWIGNVISNPGNNPNIPGDGSNADHETDSGEGRHVDGVSVLQQSFDLNAMVNDFKWPQVMTTNLAVDKSLQGDMLATVELVYSKDMNAIYMRNADLVTPVRNLADGRPYFGGVGANELNSFYPGSGEGVYVIDNVNEGSNMTITAQLRKRFGFGLNTSLAYTYLDAKNNLQSTEIASVLFQSQPVQGDPNKPNLSYAQFGLKQRIIASASYTRDWSETMSTNVGLFFEMGEGNQYVYSGGNRYSFTYGGDVNGDGVGGNDLIYIPSSASEINLTNSSDWAALDAFITQDKYLDENRGNIAERNGLLNDWFTNLDLRILQNIGVAGQKFQISLDILNFGNLINDSWGVRKAANPAALTPLLLDSWNADDEPVFSFTGPESTFTDDLGEFSRWRMQLGFRYIF
jgi:hypothetical protein